MDLRWEDYHRLNVNMLSAVGLWPYDNKFVLPLKRFVGGFFTVFGCFSQLATFITTDYTTTLLLQNVPCIFVALSMLLKYISFLVAGDSIKKVTETINGDWEHLSNKEEVQIIEKYVERSRYYTKGFAMLIWPTAACLIVLPFYPIVLDIVMPLHEPRNRSIPMMIEVFFDQQKYFFLTTFLFEGWVFVEGLVFVPTETLLIVYIQHACLLFEVTSRRITKLLNTTEGTNSQRITNDAIAQVVDMHSRAIRYSNMIREVFFSSYLILIVFGVLSLGTHLFRCTQTLASHEYTEFVTSAVFSVAILGYGFCVIGAVQHLIDLSADLFNVLYESGWYTFPPSTRKLVLFCMLKTVKPVDVEIHSLFYPSYEGFCLIMRMVMSFVTALYSVK